MEGRSAPATGRISVLQPPGTYTVTLTVDGEEHTRPLEVRKDPNSAGTVADIAQQVDLLNALKEDMEAGAEAVHKMEALRVQLLTLAKFSEDAEVTTAARTLEKKLQELELNLVDLRQTGQGQDGIRFEAVLLGKLGYLTGGMSVADFRPTDQDVEVQEILHRELGEYLAALDALVGGDVADLNAMLRSKGLGIIGE